VVAIDDERVLITADGFEQLQRELDRLQTHERRRVSAALREARADGALDDNPALIDLLNEQGQLERRIALLEARLAAAEIAPPPHDGRVAIGSFVRVRDLETGEVSEYELVGPIEGDAANGRISTAAPIGRALIGQRGGARVEVATPRGSVMLKVLDVVGHGDGAKGGADASSARRSARSSWSKRLRQMGATADGGAPAATRL
jgi:transcription elongation factor GreA